MAINKCLVIAEKIKSIDDITEDLIYDFVLYNLIEIRDIEQKLSLQTKNKFSQIDWTKFEFYDKELNNKLEFRDKEIIYDILKNELPDIELKLEKIIFEQ